MKVELLAPGGSIDSVKAAINAGADAVYTGGAMFGAREYADNLSTEDMIEVLNYAHIHGRKIYLTVNTLLKDREIEEALYNYILPFYQNGLDAVIVQDFGVMKFIHDRFKDLPIHASTQMTIMGAKTTEFLKKYGVTRIVTPRELNVREIRNIYNETGMEIESFVHGALCYCYSGQCFLSSYIGGRSGNRGKCAQPCRLNYDVISKGKILNPGDSKYVLSPKDICTLNILPDIIESGVFSLKIEGRMKKKEYAAGITALYRKYIDLYLEKGRDGYNVSSEDIQKAMDLFNRNGFSESYYKKHNGKDMISLKKPSFRMENTDLINEIKNNYIDTEPKEKINIYITILANQNVNIVATMKDICVEISGDIPLEAKSLPITEETVKKQISKLGNTPFKADYVEVILDEGLFITIGELNKLKRKMTEELEREIISKSNRTVQNCDNLLSDENIINDRTCGNEVEICGLVSNINQARIAISSGFVNRVYIEEALFTYDELKECILLGKKNNINIYLAMPHVFRMSDEAVFDKKLNNLFDEFDGFLIRNIEGYFYLSEMTKNKDTILDYNVYTFNKHSKQVLQKINPNIKTTVPVELNQKELRERGCTGEEIVVYGYMPAMTTANCVAKTCGKCDSKSNSYILKDRMSQNMNVKCVCEHCYNIIYNTKPLSLSKYAQDIKNIGVASVRLEFTTEGSGKVNEILKLYRDSFIYGNNQSRDVENSTRGHFKRGVK